MNETNETVPVEIAKELQAKVATLKAFASIHNLLTKSTYQTFQFEQAETAVEFIKQFHSELMKDASEHADAEKIPELADFKANQAKE